MTNVLNLLTTAHPLTNYQMVSGCAGFNSRSVVHCVYTVLLLILYTVYKRTFWKPQMSIYYSCTCTELGSLSKPSVSHDCQAHALARTLRNIAGDIGNRRCALGQEGSEVSMRHPGAMLSTSSGQTFRASSRCLAFCSSKRVDQTERETSPVSGSMGKGPVGRCSSGTVLMSDQRERA